MRNRILLLIGTIALVFTLSSCFSNYTEGYVKYSKVIKAKSTYKLYYKKVEAGEECPNEDGTQFTLVEDDGNKYMYYGVKQDACRLELFYDTGMGLQRIQNGFDREDFKLDDILEVNWTFDITIDQDPDYTLNGYNFIEYFEEVGDYEIYIIDYKLDICNGGNIVPLYEYDGKEYDVEGAKTGDGCVSNYYIYYDEDEDDDKKGVMLTIGEAFEKELITRFEINNVDFESTDYQVYIDEPFMAVSADIYLRDTQETHNVTNRYTLTEDERNQVLNILSTYRYKRNVEFIEGEEILGFLTLYDNLGNSKQYELYHSGIRLISEDAYIEYGFTETIYEILLGLFDE